MATDVLTPSRLARSSSTGVSPPPRVCRLTTPAPTGDGAVDCRARLHPAGYARPSDGPRPGCRANPPNTVSTRVSMYASESGALSYGTRSR
jgi:hypothetical protein